MIDIVSGPGAKADMVQSNPVLNETLAVVFGTTRLDANCREDAMARTISEQKGFEPWLIGKYDELPRLVWQLAG